MTSHIQKLEKETLALQLEKQKALKMPPGSKHAENRKRNAISRIKKRKAKRKKK